MVQVLLPARLLQEAAACAMAAASFLVKNRSASAALYAARS